MRAFCIGPSTSVAGRGFLIPGPNFSIPDPGSKRYRIHKEFRFNPDPKSRIPDPQFYFMPSRIQGPKSIGSWIQNTARYHGKARNTVKIVYCNNLNCLGLFSSFQYLIFLVLAKMSFNWSIAVFIAIDVILLYYLRLCSLARNSLLYGRSFNSRKAQYDSVLEIFLKFV
jgi:hypothetical protein